MSVGAFPSQPRCFPLCLKNRRHTKERRHDKNVRRLPRRQRTDREGFFPLPQIDQVWPTLSCARFFVSLNLLMGFHQFEVDPRDRSKTAFLTHRGLYVCNMPFELCNASATCQRLMEKVLGPLIGLGVFVYINDVLIYAETP